MSRPKGFKHTERTKQKMRQRIGNQKGSSNRHWKGGQKKVNGYVLIWKPSHPFCNSDGYVKRSRLVMEKILGRHLKPQEVVHHINGIRDDDKIENLKLFRNKSEHKEFHWTLKN